MVAASKNASGAALKPLQSQATTKPVENSAFKLSDLVPEVAPKLIFPPFEELTMLLYGDQGTGKTSFFGKAGSVLIVSTEPGARFQEGARWREVSRFRADTSGADRRLDFETMVQGILAASKEDKLKRLGIKGVVIDTVDRLHALSVAAVCEEHRVNSIGDIPYGRGYALAVEGVKQQVNLLRAALPVAFISHALTATEELESVSGIKKEVEKRKPSVDRRVAEWLAGEQNLVGYAYKSEEGKFLVKFHSDARLETKDRTGLLEKLRKPLPLDFKIVSETYAAQAKAAGIELRSRFA